MKLGFRRRQEPRLTNKAKTGHTTSAPELYEIGITSHLSESGRGRFEGSSVWLDPAGGMVLSGTPDQAALHGVLIRIRDLGLKLVSDNLVGDGRSAAPQETPDSR